MENKIKFKIMTQRIWKIKVYKVVFHIQRKKLLYSYNLIKKIKIKSYLLIQKIIIINNQKLKIFISVFQSYVRLL